MTALLQMMNESRMVVNESRMVVCYITSLLYLLILIDSFIDDDPETHIASGSGTQQHTSWRWEAGLYYGIPEGIIAQTDHATLWALVCQQKL